MKKILLSGVVICMCASCKSMMNDSGEITRVPEPPPSTSKQEKSWNVPTKAQTDTLLGPLSSMGQRR